MIERSEKAGFGIALVGHAALFALLSLRLLTRPLPVPPPQPAIEVSLAPDVALEQSSPAPAPAAPSEAPEIGQPEEAAAPPAPAPVPAPVPAPRAVAKPTPAKPVPAKPAARPNPEKLAAVVEDAERADAQRTAKAAAAKAAHDAWVDKVRAANAANAEAARQVAEARTEAARQAAMARAQAAAAKAEAAKVAAEKAEAARVAAAAAKAQAHAAWVEKVVAANAAKAEAARVAAQQADAAKAAAAEKRAKGSRLGNDFLKGLADTPKPKAAPGAPGATMSARALADIASAIKRQVQPCADRQVNPGPGADRIRVALNLKLNRDGSLAAPPRVVNHDGSSIDLENRRYLDRVDDLAIATFVGCAPLRGLPAELYDVPNGWRSITMTYRLPG